MNFNHLVNKLSKSVEKEKSTFKVGNIVKLVDTTNSRKGLDKNGRTGIITRCEGNQYEVELHCTNTGGNSCVSIFVKELNRYVGNTGEKQWFTANQLIKC